MSSANSHSYDVIVLGLGGMGSAAAYELSRRGKRVLGLEQFTAVHDRGSSHGGSRIIRQAYYENPAYVPLVQSAYELWERLERDTGLHLLSLTGGLMIGSPESVLVRGTILSAREHRLPHEVMDAAELHRRFPVFRPRPEDVGVFEKQAGLVRPEMAVRAHLQLAAKQGAELHFTERIKSWTADATGNSVQVFTEQGSYEAARLVVAAGAWASEMLPGLPVPFDVRRHVMCWFSPPAGVELFLPEHLPIYIWEVDPQQAFYGFPSLDGANGGVKAAMHSGGDRCSPATLDREISRHDIEELRQHLTRFIPGLDGPVIKAATCMYTLTPDEHFVVSKHPEFPQVAIAAGFSGHGFKFVNVIGEVLADLVIDGKTKHSIEFLSPSRFTMQTAL